MRAERRGEGGGCCMRAERREGKEGVSVCLDTIRHIATRGKGGEGAGLGTRTWTPPEVLLPRRFGVCVAGREGHASTKQEV